jgi:hypothetical protein
MPAAPLPFLDAAIAIPSASQCFMALAPVAGVAFFYALLKGIDQALSRIFAGLEWQRSLGWFNIKAERRAATVLRWLGYAVMAIMAAALFGIAWGAEGLRLLPRWTDPDTMAEINLRLPVLATSLSVLLLYFGAELLPRLRRKYEEEELAAYRAEWAALEEEKSGQEPSRVPVQSSLRHGTNYLRDTRR